MLVTLVQPATCRGFGFNPPIAHRSCYAIIVRAGPARVPQPSQTPLELPGGGYWWAGSNRTSQSFVYGNQFVIERTRVGGEGLVPASKHVNVQPYTRRSSSSGPPAVYPPREVGLALIGMVVIDTEFEEVLESEVEVGRECGEIAKDVAGPECVGIVYVGNGEGDPMAVHDAGISRHPRRTRRIRFNCNICGEENLKEVNPHAWTKGSVFARCDGCEVVHKLQDNLKIFHELGGPVFPPRHLRDSFLVQEVLDKIAARRRGDPMNN